MVGKYYHATEYSNYDSILEKGILPGLGGVIYLCKDPKDAAKFLAVRMVKDILVFEVFLDEDLVEESFDHNEAFFGCKAYMYNRKIPADDISETLNYEAV